MLTYFNAKLTWLKIAGIEDENNQCVQICEGLLDPEFRAAIRLVAMNNKLQDLRAELVDKEPDICTMWQKYNRP